MKVIDFWDDCGGEQYFTIEVNCKERCDVKKTEDGLYYVMVCDNGFEVYFPGEEDGVRDLTDEEYNEAIKAAERGTCYADRSETA